ncbi:DUF202 domain-containing protein [Demequina sp. NBRC 110056]|uniref:DUF202 domain-containing protein n=1 Tax=Demequina sp. NBRC 110056 TaxID=1570345 RepID=UPI001F16719D|nr:DUF202 domain-containing protein [Demequina sp. NBRC 110056]
MSTPRFDDGLQPERTLLSWRRTALAIAGGGAVGARVLADQIGPVSYAIGLVVVAVALGAYLLANRGYRRAVAEMVDGSGLAPAPGVAVAALAGACALLALAALAFVAVGLP